LMNQESPPKAWEKVNLNSPIAILKIERKIAEQNSSFTFSKITA